MLASLLAIVILTSGSPASWITADRVEKGPSIDGILNESVWDMANLESCLFNQFAPDFGEQMSEPTDIYVVYDDKRIYFGFRMDDPDPTTMMDALTPRDNYITGEWIAVLLDTYRDGRQATSFEVSLANSQMDSKVNPNGVWDYSWDAVWESATARTAGGWSAEMAIPLSCLRFDTENLVQSWGVNFQRILSKNVENGWYVLTESNQMADIENFAELRGISGIRGSLGAEIRPYTAERRFRNTSEGSWDIDRDLGLDMKVGVSSGIAADFAVNPDFGQVEADAVEMNLSHSRIISARGIWAKILM